METPHTILQHYWKYKQFRPVQETIINAVLQRHDVLALLPTGGGKSICFQVPAMLMNGVCVVVSPLIALMEDQVEQLHKRGIRAIALHSGLRRQQIDIQLDNCVHGDVKFLYVSPERIQTELFVERFKQMKISLIAVDEAHCISQWGYDFRPSYLHISMLRSIHHDAPVIALTATATKDVQEDIIDKLNFPASHKVFTQTFARENFSLVVRHSENKDRKLLEILNKVKGSAIIYVRSRKATIEISDFLKRNKIKAGAYHAGLTMGDRSTIQQLWTSNKTRVMVATNAFGMGIDKPDVRLVIHADLPENIESYYQEAGRGGRDGKLAYATILYHESDIVLLQSKVEQAHPSIEYLKNIYQAIANYFQLAEGSGAGESYDFDLHAFSEHFQFHVQDVYNALKKLEEEGLLQFNESYYNPSQLHFAVDALRLYEFQVANERFDPIIKMVLRLYGAELYSGFVKISEPYLAEALKTTRDEVVTVLKHLDNLQMVIYKPQKDKPQLTLILPRQDVEYLPLDKKRLAARKELAIAKMKSIVSYVTQSSTCRMQVIQEYFGEDVREACEECDVCISKRKNENDLEVRSLNDEVLFLLSEKVLSMEELEEKIAPEKHDLFVEVIREMVDSGVIEYDDVWRLKKINKDKSDS